MERKKERIAVMPNIVAESAELADVLCQDQSRVDTVPAHNLGSILERFAL